MTVNNIDRPSHYNNGEIECIEAIAAAIGPVQFEGFLRGNVLKYIWRAEHKNAPVEDLKKAKWYLERLIKEVDWQGA